MKSFYSEFITAYRNYVLSLTSDIHNRAAYDASMKHHKIDPYIAGGIGQSIAGLGGGLYAAESAAANNAKIDASRKYYQNEVISSSISLSCDETRLLDLFNRIVQIISDEPILRNKRNEILRKKEIEDYIKRMENEKLRKRAEQFEKQVEIKEKIFIAKWMRIIAYSFISAVAALVVVYF